MGNGAALRVNRRPGRSKGANRIWRGLDAISPSSGCRNRQLLALARPEMGGRAEALPNLRLLLSRFGSVATGRSPCSEHSRSTSIAAQQNR